MRILHCQGHNWPAFSYFIAPALRELSRRGHEIVLDTKGAGITPREALDEFDIDFCDWISKRARQLSNEEPGRAKLVIRAHDAEFGWKSLCQGVKWSNVALLMFPSPATYRTLWKVAPESQRVPYAFVGHPIDTERFVFQEREYGHRIGQLGLVRRRKANLLAVQWFSKLWEADDRWEMELRGWLPQGYGLRVEEEIQQLGVPVALTPKGPNGLLEWFGQQDLLWSSSYREAFHVAIAEGMSTGCYPIVRKRPGASWVFPEWSIVENGDEFVSKCLWWAAQSDEEKRQLSLLARQWIIEKHSVNEFVKRFLSAIGDIDASSCGSGVKKGSRLPLAPDESLGAPEPDLNQTLAQHA